MEIIIAFSMQQQILISSQLEHTQTLKPVTQWGIRRKNTTSLKSFNLLYTAIVQKHYSVM